MATALVEFQEVTPGIGTDLQWLASEVRNTAAAGDGLYSVKRWANELELVAVDRRCVDRTAIAADEGDIDVQTAAEFASRDNRTVDRACELSDRCR